MEPAGKLAEGGGRNDENGGSGDVLTYLAAFLYLLALSIYRLDIPIAPRSTSYIF